MSIIDAFLGVIAPHYCIGCSVEGTLLCTSCDVKGLEPISRCYRCHALTDDFRTCQSCRSSTPLRCIVAARSYDGVHKELIQSLKFNGSPAATSIIARAIVPLLSKDYIVVPLPTSSRHIRMRGFDHTKLIVSSISRERPTVQSVNALSRVGQHQQVGSNRTKRLKQLESAFVVQSKLAIHGKRIVLIDDVSTTGASLEAAAKTLKRAGARSVDAIVYAQTR